MQTDYTRQIVRQPARRRITVVRTARRREIEPLDLRTPSGRVLPY
ncbi:MAG TPA: hypothetical protein VL551_23040 [Actinospica sp.]|jgi:hypothetical protein|nr:hypothetical protein [Actinospica sp.]